MWLVGVRPNLAALKSTQGYFGAYGINADRTGEERYRVIAIFQVLEIKASCANYSYRRTHVP